MAKCMQKAQIANVLLNDLFHRQRQKVGYSCCSFGIREHITTAPKSLFWLWFLHPSTGQYPTQLLIRWLRKSAAAILSSTCCWVASSARSRECLALVNASPPPWFVKVTLSPILPTSYGLIYLIYEFWPSSQPYMASYEVWASCQPLMASWGLAILPTCL